MQIKCYKLLFLSVVIFFLLFNFASFNHPSYLHNFTTEVNFLFLAFELSILYFYIQARGDNLFHFIFITYFFLFYVLRILTLDLSFFNIESFSDFHNRLPHFENQLISRSFLNLIFSFSAISCLLAHLNFNKLNVIPYISREFHLAGVFMVLLISLLKIFLRFLLPDLPFGNILNSVFSDILIIYLSIVLFLLSDTTKKNFLLFISTIFPIIFFLSTQNSKSFIAQPVLIFLLTYLKIFGFNLNANKIKVSIFLFVASILSYFFIFNKIIFTNDSLLHLYQKNQFGYLFQGLFHRIGYLDFYLEKSLNPIYDNVFKVSDIFCSVVNRLTPFSNTYDNAHFLNRSLYSVNQLLSNFSGGEQATIFAEFFRYFGIASPLFLCASILLLFCANSKISRSKSKYLEFSWHFFPLIFYSFLDGFGIDYFIIINLVYPFCGLIIIDILCRKLINKGYFYV